MCFPQVRELAIFGRDRLDEAFCWPDRAEAYGSALLHFKGRLRFATNAAWPSVREIAALRLLPAMRKARMTFAQGIIKACPSVQEVDFLPKKGQIDRICAVRPVSRSPNLFFVEERTLYWWEEL